MASSFDEMIILYSRFLRLIAVLPPDSRGFGTPTSWALFACYFTCSVLHWNMFVQYAVRKFWAGVPELDAICEAIMSFGMMVRYYVLLSRRVEFANLLTECRDIWEMVDEEDRREVRHFERKVRRLFRWLLGFCIFTNVAYCGSAIALNIEAVRKANETHDPERFLPFRWFIPGAEDSWPGYKFNFVLQMFVSLNGTAITTTVDSAAPILIMLGAGYFRALKQRLYRVYDEAMKNGADSSQVDLELLNCCRMHQRVLGHCTRINAVMRTLFFVQLLATGYNTSLMGIKLAGHDPDRFNYLPVILLNVCQLFICQWAPDHLIDESAAISTAAYYVSFPWMRRRVGKLLILMIARAQQPTQMTAAGIVNLSLENFGSMLKGALSFFTVLRSFDA